MTNPAARVLNLQEAAEFLSTTERHLRRLVAERRIGFVKVGRFVRFQVADLDSYLAAQRVAPRYEMTPRLMKPNRGQTRRRVS